MSSFFPKQQSQANFSVFLRGLLFVLIFEGSNCVHQGVQDGPRAPRSFINGVVTSRSRVIAPVTHL